MLNKIIIVLFVILANLSVTFQTVTSPNKWVFKFDSSKYFQKIANKKWIYVTNFGLNRTSRLNSTELAEISVNDNGLTVELANKNGNLYLLTKSNVIIVQSYGMEIAPGYWISNETSHSKRFDLNPATILNEKTSTIKWVFEFNALSYFQKIDNKRWILMTNREIIELNEIYSLDHNGLAVKLVDKNRNIYFLTKYNVIIVQWSSGKEIVVPGYWSLASRTQPKRIDSNPITIMNEKKITTTSTSTETTTLRTDKEIKTTSTSTETTTIKIDTVLPDRLKWMSVQNEACYFINLMPKKWYLIHWNQILLDFDELEVSRDKLGYVVRMSSNGNTYKLYSERLMKLNNNNNKEEILTKGFWVDSNIYPQGSLKEVDICDRDLWNITSNMIEFDESDVDNFDNIKDAIEKIDDFRSVIRDWNEQPN